MDNDVFLPSGETCEEAEDNDIILLSEEESSDNEAVSSVTSMQTAVCIAVVAALIAAIYLVPDTGHELLSLMIRLTSQPEELFPDPLELLLERFGVQL